MNLWYSVQNITTFHICLNVHITHATAFYSKETRLNKNYSSSHRPFFHNLHIWASLHHPQSRLYLPQKTCLQIQNVPQNLHISRQQGRSLEQLDIFKHAPLHISDLSELHIVDLIHQLGASGCNSTPNFIIKNMSLPAISREQSA
jgi:hypothetical protein